MGPKGAFHQMLQIIADPFYISCISENYRAEVTLVILEDLKIVFVTTCSEVVLGFCQNPTNNLNVEAKKELTANGSLPSEYRYLPT